MQTLFRKKKDNEPEFLVFYPDMVCHLRYAYLITKKYLDVKQNLIGFN